MLYLLLFSILVGKGNQKSDPDVHEDTVANSISHWQFKQLPSVQCSQSRIGCSKQNWFWTFKAEFTSAFIFQIMTAASSRTSATFEKVFGAKSHLPNSGCEDGEVRTQRQGQRAYGVQCISAKLIDAAVQNPKKRMQDVGAVARQVHAG